MTSVPGGTGPGDAYGYHPPPEPGHNPYQPWSPYGGDPRAEAPRLDGVSIAAFVCALTCCAAPVGIGLGIAGIVRTKERRRTGRWAAVTGLVVGIVGTLALVAGGIGVVWYGTNVVFFDDARPGDCVDIGDSDIWKAECDEKHDAEVLYSGEFDNALLDDFDDLDPAEFCRRLPLDRRYDGLFDDPRYVIDVYFESFGDDPDDGDLFLCVVQETSGSMDQQLLDTLFVTGLAPREERADHVWATDAAVGDCFDEDEDAEGTQPIEVAQTTDSGSSCWPVGPIWISVPISGQTPQS